MGASAIMVRDKLMLNTTAVRIDLRQYALESALVTPAQLRTMRPVSAGNMRHAITRLELI